MGAGDDVVCALARGVTAGFCGTATGVMCTSWVGRWTDRRRPLLLWLLLGASALLFFCVQALTAVVMLETVSYIQHYGLLRREISAGQHEPTQAKHCWDCDLVCSNLFFLNIQLHAQHHRQPSKWFNQMDTSTAALQLPFDYPTMIIICFIPPLWRRLIHPLLSTPPVASAYALPDPQATQLSLHPAALAVQRMTAFVALLLFNNPCSLTLLGAVNRLCGRPIRSVFLCYSTSASYVGRFSFPWTVRFVHTPRVVGVFHHNGSLGLIVVLFTDEKQFSGNRQYLIQVWKAMERLRRMVGVDQINLAGSMPSEMRRLGIGDESAFSKSHSAVADLIVSAHCMVRAAQQRAERSDIDPVIVLGARGSIGRLVVQRLLEQGRQVHSVDASDSLPVQLQDKHCVLIDVSRRGALESRVPLLWRGVVVLNEVYPEPPTELLRELQERGVTVYHIAGVQGTAFPAFPAAYAGGIPCCAAGGRSELPPVLTRLN